MSSSSLVDLLRRVNAMLITEQINLFDDGMFSIKIMQDVRTFTAKIKAWHEEEHKGDVKECEHPVCKAVKELLYEQPDPSTS